MFQQQKHLIRLFILQGEIEGSALYKELMDSAENFFKQSVCSESRWGCCNVVCHQDLQILNYICIFFSTVSPGEEVLQLLHSCTPFSMEELKEKESQLPQEDSK